MKKTVTYNALGLAVALGGYIAFSSNTDKAEVNEDAEALSKVIKVAPGQVTWSDKEPILNTPANPKISYELSNEQ